MINNSKPQDEFNDLMQALQPENAVAEQAFTDRLQRRVLTTSKVQGGSSILNALSQRWFTSSAFIVAVSFVLFVVIFKPNLFSRTTTNLQADLQPETKALITKVFTNNPQVALGSQSTNEQGSKLAPVATSVPTPTETVNTVSGSSSAASIPADPQEAADAEYARAKDFNYSYTKNQVTIGAASDKCSIKSPPATSVVETYEFRQDSAVYTKVRKSDSEGNLISYQLTTPDHVIDYRGGNYALEFPVEAKASPEVTTSTTSVSSASTSTSSTSSVTSVDTTSADNTTSTANREQESTALNFFGNSVQVSDLKQIGDKTYYELSWQASTDCGDTSEKSNLIYVVQADSQTYDAFHTEVYLDKVDPDQLLWKQDNVTDTRSANLEEVKRIFEYDLANVPLQIANDSFPFKSNQLSVFAEQAQGTLIFPDLNKVELQKLVIPDIDYLARDFYPSGEAGDKIYQQALSSYAEILGSGRVIVYIDQLDKNQKSTISAVVNIYSSKVSNDQITKSYQSMGTTKLPVEQNEIDVEVFKPLEASSLTSSTSASADNNVFIKEGFLLSQPDFKYWVVVTSASPKTSNSLWESLHLKQYDLKTQLKEWEKGLVAKPA